MTLPHRADSARMCASNPAGVLDCGSEPRSSSFCAKGASAIIFTFAGGGPYVVVTQMGRTSAEYGAWFASSGFA